MMKKYAVLDENTGLLVRTGLLPLTDFDKQTLAAGERLIQVDEDLDGAKEMLDLKTGSFVPRAEWVEVKTALPRPPVGHLVVAKDADGKFVPCMWDGEFWRRVLLGEVVEVGVDG